MFLKRVLSAIVFGAIVVLIVLNGLWLFFATVCIVAILSAIEFSQIAKLSLRLKLLVIFLSCLICLSAFRPGWIDVKPILFLAICLPFFLEILRREPGTALLNVSAALLGTLYVGWLFGYHLILLRLMSGGRNLIFLLAGITWGSDIGAYLVGRWFGKHKVIPAISPGKSWEGYIAGIVFSCIVALTIHHFLLPNIWILHILVLAIGLTVVGQIGDLAESLLKRGAKVKDSGKIMPGHGGILDRCDSMIFITPALYYYVSLLVY